MKRLIFIVFCLFAVPALAQVGPAPGIQLNDEGTPQGRVQILNCTGAGITCSKSSVTGTLNATGGGGSFSVTETEIDFTDTSAFFFGTFLITDAAISSSSKIIVSQSGAAPTGKDADEPEMDAIECRAAPGTGQLTLYCQCYESCHGTHKVNYAFS